jgi:hypothetical protein
MAHLDILRQGWTNERLAELVLSRVAFVGKPAVIADDIGADFYCTLISRQRVNRRQHLFPSTPFVVQVKSSTRVVSLTRHLDYLLRLESPFFIGVVNAKLQTLTLYSGRYLQFLLAYKGSAPKSVTARFSAHSTISKRSISNAAAGPQDRIRLVMPKLVTLEASSGRRLLDRQAAIIHKECIDIALGTYNRLTGQFIFPFPNTPLRVIIAGSGSVQYFRKNFEDRLTEYMRNVEWLMKRRPSAFKVSEAQAIVEAAGVMRPWLPNGTLFTRVFQRLRKAVV